MYFGTENIPLSSSGGNLLQYLTSLMITFWIYPGYNLIQLVTLTASQLTGFNNFFKATITRKTSIKEVTKLCCALDLNITIFQAGGLSAWRPGGSSSGGLSTGGMSPGGLSSGGVSSGGRGPNFT